MSAEIHKTHVNYTKLIIDLRVDNRKSETKIVIGQNKNKLAAPMEVSTYGTTRPDQFFLEFLVESHCRICHLM